MAEQPVIQFGSEGPAVARLQEDLGFLGYLVDAVGDGVFGQATFDAVVQFQSDMGLFPDGVVSPDTWFVLEGPVPTFEQSFDLTEFPALAMASEHGADPDADAYLARLGIEPI